ncbi:MAG: hypothetical protein ACK559_04465, partial [bacterium]
DHHRHQGQGRRVLGAPLGRHGHPALGVDLVVVAPGEPRTGRHRRDGPGRGGSRFHDVTGSGHAGVSVKSRLETTKKPAFPWTTTFYSNSLPFYN